MQIKPLLIVLACLSAYTFSSCENTSGMGYDILPEEDKSKTIITDTFSLQLKTVTAKTVARPNETRFLLGEFKDPVFGKTKAAFTTQFFYSNTPKFEENDVVDSIKLYLPLDSVGKFYPATPNLCKFNLKIYRSKEILQKDSTYYNNQDFADFRGDLLAESAVTVNRTDSVLSVHLPLSFAQEIIKAPESSFESPENFLQIFQGLFIETENMEGDSVLLKIFDNLDTKITLYYREDSENKVYNFYSGGIGFNIFKHDYSNTSFAAHIDTFGKGEFAYLQATGGLRVKISIPYIDHLKDKNILIQKAELILKAHLNDTVQYPPIISTGIYGITGDESYFLLSEYLSTANKLQTYEGTELKNGEYHFDIASFITKIMNNGAENSTLMLYPIHDNHNTRRTIINSENSNNKPKLIISYLEQ